MRKNVLSQYTLVRKQKLKTVVNYFGRTDLINDVILMMKNLPRTTM